MKKPLPYDDSLHLVVRRHSKTLLALHECSGITNEDVVSLRQDLESFAMAQKTPIDSILLDCYKQLGKQKISKVRLAKIKAYFKLVRNLYKSKALNGKEGT
jgi:hypothetical protein